MTCLELAEKGGIVGTLFKLEDHDYLARQWRLRAFYQGGQRLAFSAAAYAAAALLRGSTIQKISPKGININIRLIPLPGGRGRVLESSDER